MPQFLELAQFSQANYMPQMNIGANGVEALFEPEWPAGLQ